MKIDFSNALKREKLFDGANGAKLSILYNDDVYMLKFPSDVYAKQTELSYSNSSISEYISSHIFSSIGFNTHETLLGTYTTENSTKIVCACKDFTYPDKRLFNFISVKNSVVNSVYNGTGTELSSICETMEKQPFLDPSIVSDRFWNMFVVDSLIGNFDRHNGNWGFLGYQDAQIIGLAPIFDCGSSLLPQADQSTIEKVLNDPSEMDKRIYEFPTSAIKIHGKKIRYYDFMTSGENEDCNRAIQRIVPHIDMEAIRGIIDETPYITDLQKEFYSSYLDNRYKKIIEPAYERSKEALRNQSIWHEGHGLERF